MQAKYTELVMKCLWKLTKLIQDMITKQRLKVNQLLLDIHNFLVASPPAIWKKRLADKVPLTDMPFRTVKTILHELINALGFKVFEHLDLISDPEKSYVHQYLTYMINDRERKAEKESPANVSENSGSPKSDNSNHGGDSSISTGSAEEFKNETVSESTTVDQNKDDDLSQHQETLKQIFEKISKMETTKEVYEAA